MLVTAIKFGKEERAACTSLDVAETFGKEHKHVLRDIRELGCSKEFRLSNFGESSYTNAQNKKQPMFLMTRGGFRQSNFGPAVYWRKSLCTREAGRYFRGT